MATLREIRNLLLEKTGEDIFEPHPLYKDITDLILTAGQRSEVTDYANLLEDIEGFCEEQLAINGFRDRDE